MSSIFSGFFSGSGGSDRVGSVVAGFYGNASPDYERLDGRALTRASYPDLSLIFPIGKHTGTQRTLPSNAPAGGPVIATPTYFVAAGPSSTGSILYSGDGASWSTATTPSATPVTLCAMAARIVAVQSGVAPAIASATLDPSSAWSTTPSGGPNSLTIGNHFSRMAYSASLGRMVVAATQRYTMDDASTTWTSRTGSGAFANPVGVCWTGNRFLLIAAGSVATEISTDGITYTAGALLAEATAASQGNIASDGAGTVVVSGGANGLQVSHDHGLTWLIGQIPGVAASDTWRVQRAGGRFVIPTVQGLAFSNDGDNWFLETTPVQAMTIAGGVARKGAVTVQVAGGGAVAYSFAESATEFPLPSIRSTMPVASGTPTAGPPLYIKAR